MIATCYAHSPSNGTSEPPSAIENIHISPSISKLIAQAATKGYLTSLLARLETLSCHVLGRTCVGFGVELDR